MTNSLRKYCPLASNLRETFSFLNTTKFFCSIVPVRLTLSDTKYSLNSLEAKSEGNTRMSDNKNKNIRNYIISASAEAFNAKGNIQNMLSSISHTLLIHKQVHRDWSRAYKPGRHCLPYLYQRPRPRSYCR